MTQKYLSFDIEDWYHAHNLWSELERESWTDYESRVVENTRDILELLDKHDTKGTFFVLGYVAEESPHLVKEIDERGHELASHGYNHEVLYEQTPEKVREDIERSLDLLNDASAQQIQGYRAPSYTITDWALEILDDLDLEYDSSHVAASAHDRYGSIEVEDTNTFTKTSNGLSEVQLPTLDCWKANIPWAGGGYFRVIPYPIYKQGIKRISESRDFVFYLHPWELDPEQPRVENISKASQIRHYRNIDKTKKKLDKLLSDFDWKPIREGLEEDNLSAHSPTFQESEEAIEI